MKSTHITNRIIWILLAFIIWCPVIADTLTVLTGSLMLLLAGDNCSPAMTFILETYTPIVTSCLVFVLVCLAVRKNRFLLEVIRPSAEKKSMRKLGIGLLLGFLTNFFCILCALLHGDIKLYYDFSLTQIPIMLFAFISVFFQSASEELWCRVFLYDRINVHYPLWAAIVLNSAIFAALHIFNPGLTVLAMADLLLCGFAYSLLRWHTGSIWASFGIHTMWNFTQNFIFGLPNSGLVSEASIFHLDASTGISNAIYDYEFGVEGAWPAVLMELLLIVVILLLAKRSGRLGELLMSREKSGTYTEPEHMILKSKRTAEASAAAAEDKDAE